MWVFAVSTTAAAEHPVTVNMVQTVNSYWDDNCPRTLVLIVISCKRNNEHSWCFNMSDKKKKSQSTVSVLF